MKKHAVIGVGNPFRGDDGIGVFLLQKLQKQYTILKGTIDFIDGGTGGMNLFHLISPYEIVILIDAVDFRASAGTVKMFKLEQLSSLILSTHTLSPRVFIDMIRRDIEVNVCFIGIQPAQTALGQPLSTKVNEALKCLEGAFTEIFPPGK